MYTDVAEDLESTSTLWGAAALEECSDSLCQRSLPTGEKRGHGGGTPQQDKTEQPRHAEANRFVTKSVNKISGKLLRNASFAQQLLTSLVRPQRVHELDCVQLQKDVIREECSEYKPECTSRIESWKEISLGSAPKLHIEMEQSNSLGVVNRRTLQGHHASAKEAIITYDCFPSNWPCSKTTNCTRCTFCHANFLVENQSLQLSSEAVGGEQACTCLTAGQLLQKPGHKPVHARIAAGAALPEEDGHLWTT
mmetsp:Transcript_130632/g.227119  ORF Transcript_130632/g.227119 Transcript_130632/m.227119 type:complete len:251 (-) Transcript_130632:160-912(-)